jgi:hypothetical protein
MSRWPVPACRCKRWGSLCRIKRHRHLDEGPSHGRRQSRVNALDYSTLHVEPGCTQSTWAQLRHFVRVRHASQHSAACLRAHETLDSKSTSNLLLTFMTVGGSKFGMCVVCSCVPGVSDVLAAIHITPPTAVVARDMAFAFKQAFDVGQFFSIPPSPPPEKEKLRKQLRIRSAEERRTCSAVL